MFSKALNETLVYLIRENKILFIEKKRGFGKDFINGVGGKVEEDETIEQGAIREVREEVNVNIVSLEKRGVILFINNDTETLLVHVFVSSDFDGEPFDSDEAKPIWIDKNNIPYERTWGDDKYWLPKVLAGKFIYAEFIFKDWKLERKVFVKEC